MSILQRLRSCPWPWGIFLLALTLRLIYFVEMQGHPFFIKPILDGDYYDNWARAIAGGDLAGGTKAYWASPFYAYFLAAVYSLIGHSYNFVRLIQCLFGALTCSLTYLIGFRLFNQRVGIIASLLVSFSGFMIFMDNEILKNSLAMFTFTCSIYLMMGATERRSILQWLAVGLLLGLTIINQPNFLLLAPLFAIMAVTTASSIGRRIVAASCLCAGVTVFVGTTALRNYLVERDIILVTYTAGPALFGGNNPVTDGGIQSSSFFPLKVVDEESQSRRIAEETVGRTLKSSEISRFWSSKAWEFFRTNPAKAAGLLGRKLLLTWNWYEIPDNVDYYYVRRFSKLLSLPLVSFGLIAPLALTGMILACRDWRRHLFPLAVIAIFSATVTVFSVFGRYRLPLLPLLVVYAGFALTSLWEYLNQSRFRALGGTLFLIAVFGFLTTRTIVHYPEDHSQKILGELYKEAGNCQKALELWQPLLNTYPHNMDQEFKLKLAFCLENTGATAAALDLYRQTLVYETTTDRKARIHGVIGDLLTASGNRKEALKHYQEALQLAPNSAELLDGLGTLYLREQECGKAFAMLQRAQALAPLSPDIIRHLHETEQCLGR